MPLPRFFGISQEVDPPIIHDGPVIPPIDTGGNFTTSPTDWGGTPIVTVDFVTLVMVIVLVLALVVFLWWWYDRSSKKELKDIRPSVRDISSQEVSLNRAMFVQMLPFFPPLVGITPVLMMAPDNPELALAIFIGLISLPALLYMYMKNQSLENNKGKVNMSGYLRTRDGIRMAYFWRNVRFKTEKYLNEEEMKLLAAAKVQKAISVPIPELEVDFSESDDSKEKKKEKKEAKESRQKAKLEEGLTIEYSPDVWTDEAIRKAHPIPINVDDKHDVYIMTVNLPTEWEYVEGEDYDYYGYHDVQVTGPEVREIATMHRVIELDNGDYRDVYVPVFLVMYDDKMSANAFKKIPEIDVTRDVALAGLVKAIGVEERTTAGELNSITQQVMVLENEDKDVDDLSQTLARKKALDFINAEKRLTMFDIGMLGTISTLTAIIFAIVTFALGYSMGG